MAEQEEINITKMLIDISERLAKVEANTRHLDSTANEARQALNIAKENQKDIADLNERSRWNQRTSITAILIPLGLFLFQKFIGG